MYARLKSREERGEGTGKRGEGTGKRGEGETGWDGMGWPTPRWGNGNCATGRLPFPTCLVGVLPLLPLPVVWSAER